LAPEYAMRGHLTEKADVFGFGVVALEILSGRPNSDNSLDTEKIYLLEWVRERNYICFLFFHFLIYLLERKFLFILLVTNEYIVVRHGLYMKITRV
jgi:hypothetical protein